MKRHLAICLFAISAANPLPLATAAHANSYREQGKAVEIDNTGISVVPPRDWNKLSIRPGKFAETWTLDGEQLNDVTFFGSVEAGNPLVREKNKKREPLPKFTENMLLIEIPELLENTYRAYKKIGKFEVIASSPGQFLGKDGVHFSYEYLDEDDLPRRGEAQAVIVRKKLYMVTYDAPRLHYFNRSVEDFRALAASAQLK